ncbi:hypothetical protein N9089_05600 [Crocinitomicaceae bacterium]|nr:hypothetical protein [Crocinitomicaceae bacterium]
MSSINIRYTVLHTAEDGDMAAIGVYDTRAEAKVEAEALANHWYEQTDHYADTKESFDDVSDSSVMDSDYDTYYDVNGQSWRIISLL